MDDYLFHFNVKNCRQVSESTSYLEIMNYSVGHVQASVYAVEHC